MQVDLSSLAEGIPESLPPPSDPDETVDHAPARRSILDSSEEKLAIRNALRYFPSEWHQTLAPEFLNELRTLGRIYMHRFRPLDVPMRAYPIDQYPARSSHAAAIMHMIQNNLDPAVAQVPHELITYGGNGAVFQNWAQYRIAMKHLCEMTDDQTLVMYSGHPLGLFPSNEAAPRVVVTNGMVIPNHSSKEDYDRMNALGVSQYGQMTAGSYMYIGPQGIVHGTTITLMNAARLYLDLPVGKDLSGIRFVTSGLGGMSGAQAKAAVIAGASCIVAESNPAAAEKRHQQGWVDLLFYDVDLAIDAMIDSSDSGEPRSIGYVGNIVTLWERLVEREVEVHLGSDQTSLHNPFQGGYFPADLDFEDATTMLSSNPEGFAELVRDSLIRHVEAVNTMVERGMYFWDYGNAFLLEAERAGASITDEQGDPIYPSYVEDIMGPLCFDLGFGPFRWVVTSADPKDLQESDRIAADVLRSMMESAAPSVKQQIADNLRWIEHAQENALVVGSQARILYADDVGRRSIALAFNQAIAEGRISSPIVLGRDHHDVSGTDSPYRETANIRDGSRFTADMAVHNFVGDAFRGATWVSLHNGGGVGWGEVMNGGFGMVIDGSESSRERIESMLHWDVNNGIARRAWARNQPAEEAIERAMANEPRLKVNLPNHVSDELMSNLFGGSL
ncbi:MAG: urocanate hydratase [Candidatus Thermoplasmatota archaeon]|nr:urocanate hydratase [Candidatus Thermoplasmatota archaeon]